MINVQLDKLPRRLGNNRPVMKYVFENPTRKPVNLTIGSLKGGLVTRIRETEEHPYWALELFAIPETTLGAVSYHECSYFEVSVEVEE